MCNSPGEICARIVCAFYKGRNHRTASWPFFHPPPPSRHPRSRAQLAPCLYGEVSCLTRTAIPRSGRRECTAPGESEGCSICGRVSVEQLAQARERAHVANRLETHLLSRCSERTRCNPCPTWNNCCAIPAATTRRLRRGFAPQTTGRETKALDNKYTLSFGHHSDADEAQPAIELTLTKAQSEFVKGERYRIRSCF